MTSRELIAAEANNTDRIALYREGLFWKAYERSAYALCTQVRAFKPTRKILKTLAGGDIVSVGFPAIAADRILAGLRRLDLPADTAAGSAAPVSGVAVAAADCAATSVASPSDDSSLSCISDASSAAGASAAAVTVSAGADACAAGSVANASVGSCAAPKASSATRMLLAAPHPIVERDFLAWKSALPISLTIPRPSAVESSCEDPTSGEPSSHDLPLREVPSAHDRSLRGAVRPVSGLAASDGAVVDGVAAPAAHASQPHWWTRLGGRLVRWAARSGSPRAVAATMGFSANIAAPAVSAAPANACPARDAAPSADTAASSASTAMAEQCLDALRKFEVADKTPMECMLFIAELKKRFLKI